mmetsp:Transcript_19928/g.55996  ORF Transcript_19928/g.55996 Transcript_19928/m.55996 type:complete len:247 (+) Transcript_19928:1148-1888(+)
MALRASRSVGGLAFVVRCTTNSSGTLARASLPRICSRGIQPSALSRSSQLARHARLKVGSQRCTRSWWNPSSQRKPRGKKDLEGTAENSAASKYGSHEDTAPAATPETRLRPWKYPMPPSMLLSAYLASAWVLSPSGIGKVAANRASNASTLSATARESAAPERAAWRALWRAASVLREKTTSTEKGRAGKSSWKTARLVSRVRSDGSVGGQASALRPQFICITSYARYCCTVSVMLWKVPTLTPR